MLSGWVILKLRSDLGTQNGTPGRRGSAAIGPAHTAGPSCSAPDVGASPYHLSHGDHLRPVRRRGQRGDTRLHDRPRWPAAVRARAGRVRGTTCGVGRGRPRLPHPLTPAHPRATVEAPGHAGPSAPPPPGALHPRQIAPPLHAAGTGRQLSHVDVVDVLPGPLRHRRRRGRFEAGCPDIADEDTHPGEQPAHGQILIPDSLPLPGRLRLLLTDALLETRDFLVQPVGDRREIVAPLLPRRPARRASGPHAAAPRNRGHSDGCPCLRTHGAPDSRAAGVHATRRPRSQAWRSTPRSPLPPTPAETSPTATN